ncbi:MAG TPA: M23 family metallopeptidase [Prolixibacteraceae bacterium]|nr:M23 family metallopeptidase [Prolixibacteraceae bacterium]
MNKKNDKAFWKKITRKYRLAMFEQDTLNEVYTTFVTRLKAGALIFLICFGVCALTLSLIFFTPARRLVPGYPSRMMSEQIRYNAVMTDSLLAEIAKRDEYLLLIRKAISGEVIEDSSQTPNEEFTHVELEPVSDDSLFNSLIGPEKYKFSYQIDGGDELSGITFFSPVRGLITNRFNASPGHFGTDIVGTVNTPVSTVLDGTVIFAEWSVTTGYVVQIQHANNMISIYKHNSEALVKPGDRVLAGDIIAMMGNEGEYSTGPHLHFELWHNGSPLDPEKYIQF